MPSPGTLQDGRSQRRPPILLLLAAAAVALATVLPLFYVLRRAFDSGLNEAQDAIVRPRTLELLGNTLSLVVTVTILTLIIGIASAFVISRVRLPGGRLWWVLACLPLAVPSYVAAFALLSVVPTANGFWPTVLVLTLTTAPYVTVPTLAALSVGDHSLAAVARTLGHGPVRVFFRVTLPQILPASLAGAMLVALYAMADFGAPAMLRQQTLTVGIYAQYTGSVNRSIAASMALILVVLALFVVLIERYFRRTRGSHTATVAVREPPKLTLSPLHTTMVVAGLAAVFAVSVLAPVAAVVLRLLEGSRYQSEPGELAQAAVTTTGLGILAAVIATSLALPISYLAARYRSKLVAVLESVSFVGHALPGIVFALAFVFLSLALFPGAYQGIFMLVACYVVLFLPKAIGSARSAFVQVSPRLEETSRTLGKGVWQTWSRVSLRGAAPGIAAGGLLVMVTVMKELPATLMLRPIGVDTLATELWGKTSMSAFGAAAPAAILLILVGVIPAWYLARTAAKMGSESADNEVESVEILAESVGAKQ